MFTSTDFTFNGIKASSFSLKLIRMDSSMFIEEPIVGGASLTEVDFANDFRPYLYKVRRSPIEFSLQLALVDANDRPIEWTTAKKSLIYNWLFHNSYKELVFDDEPDVYFYALALSEPKLRTTYGQGYIEVNFRTNSPYAWSPLYEVSIIGNALTDTTAMTFNLNNKPKPVYDKVYLKTLLTRIGTSVGNPNFTVGTMASVNTITLDDSKITGVNTVLFDGTTKTVWSSDLNWRTITPLYQHRLLTRGDNFPYLTADHLGSFSLSAGWNAIIRYQYPILR